MVLLIGKWKYFISKKLSTVRQHQTTDQKYSRNGCHVKKINLHNKGRRAWVPPLRVQITSMNSPRSLFINLSCALWPSNRISSHHTKIVSFPAVGTKNIAFADQAVTLAKEFDNACFKAVMLHKLSELVRNMMMNRGRGHKMYRNVTGTFINSFLQCH